MSLAFRSRSTTGHTTAELAESTACLPLHCDADEIFDFGSQVDPSPAHD
jgi:hypothetical protein